MTVITVLQFALATLLPVAATACLFMLRRGKLANLPEKGWQALVGCVFGAIAVYGTEFGIPVDGAMMNVRDAAPIIAGLFFGGPAGVIAGVIGGVERWIAVEWGVGAFTQTACTVGTIFAGVYAALLRKYLFDNRMPGWAMSLAIGIVAEVVHLLLVFLTNFDQEARAFAVVQACALPMITCVAISVALASVALALLGKQPLLTTKGHRGVAQIVQSRLLVAVVIAFFVTNGFMAAIQENMAKADTQSLLELNIHDVENYIADVSDKHLLELTRQAAHQIGNVESATNEKCVALTQLLGVAEVHVIDSNGIIVATNVPEFVGFDMTSGDQAAAFLPLIAEGELVQQYQPISYDNSVWRKYAGCHIEGGLVQVGYDASDFTDDLATQIMDAVHNRHIGQTGQVLVVDSEGSVTGSDGILEDESAENLIKITDAHEEGEIFDAEIMGEEGRTCYKQIEGYHVIAYLPTSEAVSSMKVSVMIMSFMELLVFAALFLIMYFIIKRVVVRSIWEVNETLGKITDGNLDAKVDVCETEEFMTLSEDINATVGALKESIDIVKADLAMAADIQMNSLPAITDEISGREEFDLAATMNPAKEVGGDFYDFFMVDDDHLALVVADVSGKGVPAALFMMKSKTIMKMETMAGAPPSAVLYQTNLDLQEKDDSEMFTTAWLGILELSSGRLIYADAGHEKLAIRREGTWTLPDKPNRAVALASMDREMYEMLPDHFHYRDCEITLAPGDGIFQYTDGVTEATDAENQLFGEERLLDTLTTSNADTAAQTLADMKEAIDDFVGEAPQFDDITMLGLIYKGNTKQKG